MVIEFAGLPKSGKSSTIGIVRDYFLRNGYTVRLYSEGARMCPFSNQHRVEIASWTANRALNSVLESSLSVDRSTLVLQDLGLFDSLAFFKLLILERLISTEEYCKYISYFADIHWSNMIDIVIIMGVTPQEAISRDIAAKISAKPGIITNLPTLHKLLLHIILLLINMVKTLAKLSMLTH